MQFIEKIEINLENCEIITFSAAEIGTFEINGTHFEYKRSGASAIIKTLCSDEFLIEIFSQANRKENFCFSCGTDILPFDRLSGVSDIASCGVFLRGRQL